MPEYPDLSRLLYHTTPSVFSPDRVGFTWTMHAPYFLESNGTRTSQTMFPGVWHAKTQIQLRPVFHGPNTYAMYNWEIPLVWSNVLSWLEYPEIEEPQNESLFFFLTKTYFMKNLNSSKYWLHIRRKLTRFHWKIIQIKFISREISDTASSWCWLSSTWQQGN